MPNDRDINQANQPTDPAEDLSDLPELIDCDPNVEPHTAPPQPQVFLHWANVENHPPIAISMSYLNTDAGEWVVIPFPTNVVPPPAIRMITDNVSTQFRAYRRDIDD